MAAEELPEHGTAGGQYEPMRSRFTPVGRDEGHVEEFRPRTDTLQGGANRGMVVRPSELVVIAAPHCSQQTDRHRDGFSFFLAVLFCETKKGRSLSHFPNSNVLK
jgi:hypothetical protein